MNLKILVPISLIGLALSCSSRRDGAQAPEAVIPVKVGNVRRIHTTQTVPVGGACSPGRTLRMVPSSFRAKWLRRASTPPSWLPVPEYVNTTRSSSRRSWCPTVWRVSIGVVWVHKSCSSPTIGTPGHSTPLHFGLKRRRGFERIPIFSPAGQKIDYPPKYALKVLDFVDAMAASS